MPKHASAKRIPTPFSMMSAGHWKRASHSESVPEGEGERPREPSASAARRSLALPIYPSRVPSDRTKLADDPSVVRRVTLPLFLK